jgi:Tol biopolymer transport system component
MTPTSRLLAPGALLALLVLLALTAGGAGATSIAERTVRVSADGAGGSADGESSNAVLSATGRFVAYDTAATNVSDVVDPNGPIRDVVLVDTAARSRRLVTAGGDGPSFDPAISADGRRIAFMSRATNLVAEDTNGVTDVFWRDGDGPIVRVSVAEDGAQANGVSSQPDISGDGRRIVFTSSASNLVPGDTNGRPDVFVRDLTTGRTVRVTEGRSGTSSTPAVSSDGRWVSFFSSSRLVADDRNGRADVYVRSLTTGEIDLVSVSSSDRQQNRSIAAPFTQVSALSGNGRYVVFDSDATNLVEGDTNRDTDVFLRDRRDDRTERVSVSAAGRQGNNDSFNPTITISGRYVGFESFAENLIRGSSPREDVFVRDRRLDTTSLLGVGSDNRPRGAELVRQLLQRPAVSEDGRVGLFTTTARGVDPGDGNVVEDVFLRRLDPPRGTITARPPSGRDRRPAVTLAADDPGATRFLCRIDRRRPFDCPLGTSRLPRVSGGRHVLTVRAGGMGMLYDPARVTARFTIEGGRRARARRRAGPRASIRRPRGRSVRTIRGTARGSRVARVEVAVIYFVRGNACQHLVSRRRFTLRACGRARTYVRAQGARSWRLRLPRSITGPIFVSARATDRDGNRGRPAVVRTVLRR